MSAYIPPACWQQNYAERSKGVSKLSFSNKKAPKKGQKRQKLWVYWHLSGTEKQNTGQVYGVTVLMHFWLLHPTKSLFPAMPVILPD